MSRKNFMSFSDSVQNVFETEDTYLEFSSLLVDTARDNIKVYTAEQANEKIREKFHEILGTNDKSTRKELRKAIRRNKIEIYEVIEETVENLLITGWGENPFFDDFVDMRNLSIGDENEFYVTDDSVLTVSEVSGNHHALIRQRLGAGSTYKIKTSWYGVKIYAEYELFMAGKVDWAGFIRKVYEAFDKKVNGMVYESLMSAGDKLPANTQFNKNGELTAENKKFFIDLVQDVQTATGKEVVVMGTMAGLSKLGDLTSVDWVSEDMKKERNTTGRVGYWEGIRTVLIPQVFADNNTGVKLVDNNKLLIMPLADNKFIKLVNEGEAQVKETTDGATNFDQTIEYEYQQKMGVSTIINMIFGVWNIVD